MTEWITELPFFGTPYADLYEHLKSVRLSGVTILPEPKNVFRAFQLTPFNEVKVVILGQDPYPTPGHATGLAFDVPNNTKPLPPTLVNIHKEWRSDLTKPTPDVPNLEEWAKQGVLLLNTALTVEAGKANSHTDIGWSTLSDQAIKHLSDHRENLVFILWGNHAQRKVRLIDEEKHHIILSAHPSPLAAYRGFFGSKPFSRTNVFLASKNIPPINW